MVTHSLILQPLIPLTLLTSPVTALNSRDTHRQSCVMLAGSKNEIFVKPTINNYRPLTWLHHSLAECFPTEACFLAIESCSTLADVKIPFVLSWKSRSKHMASEPFVHRPFLKSYKSCIVSFHQQFLLCRQ